MMSFKEIEKELKKEASTRTLDDMDNKLRSFLEDLKERKGPVEPQKKESQIVFKALKDVEKNGELFVKMPVKLKRESVKHELTDDDIYNDVENGLRRSQMARKYGISRSAITQRVNKLKRLGFLEEKHGELKIKKIVKDLALSTLPSRKKLQLQTIHITIPIKNPGIIDTLKWDKDRKDIHLKVKKQPYKKVTIRRMGKDNPVIILSLHSRWIEKIEQIKELCDNYVSLVARQLKEHDIELDTSNYRTNGLHLWEKDKVVEKNYEKKMGMIGVYHGVQASKIGPRDNPTERKTWIETTPTPDGIETNDPSFVDDKKTVEYVMGKPDTTVPLKDPDRELPKYMKNVTDFVTSMKAVGNTFQSLDKRLEMYNVNVKKHIELVDTIKEQTKNQTEIMQEMRDMVRGFKGVEDTVKEVKSISKSLMTEVKIRNIEDDMIHEKKPEFREILCPLCGASFSEKYLLEHGFRCPNRMCESHEGGGNLRLYFPDI